MTVCRVCLCSKPRKDITQLNPTENGETQSYKHVMLFCLGIQVDTRSDISTKLCVKCYRKTVQFYQFKTLALKNDAHLRSLDSSEFKSEVFMKDNDIKIEKVDDSDFEYPDEDEPLIQIKEDVDPTKDLIIEVKTECKPEEQSDEEFLSVIKTLKMQTAEETKENAPVIKKRGRPKQLTKRIRKEVNKIKVCAECGKEVKDLSQHMQKHLPLELRKMLKCELCDSVFSSYPARSKHIKRKHLALRKQCHLCDKSVFNLRQHITIVHESDSLPYQCVSCGRRFMTQTRLDVHVTVHTKDRPHECDICGSKFRIKLSLSNHKRQVHEKEKSHLCQFCSKSFFKKHHLNIHLRSHTKEKPYNCPDCGKNFTSSTTLRNHRLIHGEDKTYKCTMCDMSFATRNYLRAHTISHTKVKRYPCQFCGVKFHRSDHRKRHEYTAHLRHHTSGNT